jgi:hypothetical protein
MHPLFKLVLSSAIAIAALQSVSAQDLAPRAYTLTPLHANALTLTYGFYDGSLLLNGAIPVNHATGKYSVPVASLYHSFEMFGHFANLTAVLPYAVGTFQGDLKAGEVQIYRSGLVDSTYRLAVNLKGGPPLEPAEFHKWKQKTLIGVSLKVVAPTGQYDPAKVINWGGNRWALKPELAYSQRWGKIVLDAYGGVWFYTLNSQYFTGHNERTENPVGAFEGHLSYDWKLRTWVSLDGNFWFGGTTSLNGIPNPDTTQTGSRLGVTGSVRLDKHQSIKVSYSAGTYARFGGNYRTLSTAWQWSWLGHPR